MKENHKEKTVDPFKKSIGKFRELLQKITFAKGTGQPLNKRFDFKNF